MRIGSADEIYVPLGTTADYSAATQLSRKWVATAHHDVKGIVLHVNDAGTTTPTVWDLYVNSVDAAVGFMQPLSLGADSGLFFGADRRFQVNPGDLIALQPDGADGGTTPVAFASLVLSRGNRSSNEIYASMGFTTAYDSAVALDQQYAAQENMLVTGLAVHYQQAPSTAPTEWQLFVNGANSGCGFVGPVSHTGSTGIILGPDSRYEVVEGDLLSIVPNGADGGTGVNGFATLILTR